MAYVGAFKGTKEDMQDDTFHILSHLVIEMIVAYKDKNVKNLYELLDVIFGFVGAKFPKTNNKDISFFSKLELIRPKIYDLNNKDQYKQNQLFDELRPLYRELNKVLINKGILLRIEADLDTLVTQRP